MDKNTAWLGMATGLAGSFLIAVGFYLLGFGAFLTSNVFWIWHSLLTRNWPLAIMQVGFTASSLLGIYNNA